MISVSRQSTLLTPELAAANEQIRATAKSYGLDFFDVIFEMLDFDQINHIASYGGFPVRYPHWRFGMEYERTSKQHNYGLGRIYEMVINSDPCYAYLQRSNSVMDQKLVMAHVYAHCDFFKNNLWFSKTDRKMMDGMANHATRVRKHIEHYGIDKVEAFLDTCLSLEYLIDAHSPFLNRGSSHEVQPEEHIEDQLTRFQSKGYMDRFINPRKLMEEERVRLKSEQEKRRKIIPSQPVRDVLLFMLEHAPLEPWQQDILNIVRDESYYFAPQGMTKVMNEGWATYWHSTIMTKHYLSAAEIIDYADHHSGTVHMPPGNFNPYKIGVEIFRDIEDRWDHGRHGKEYDELDTLGGRDRWEKKDMGEGRKKIFEVRRIYNDVNFIDEFLTEEMVDRLKLYQYRRDPNTGQMRIVSRDYKRIKEALLYRLSNMGQPYIYVVDANYRNAGELYLAHKHNGLDIEIKYAVETLKNLHKIWTRPVHLQARVDDDMMLFSFDGKQNHQQKIHDDLPKPRIRCRAEEPSTMNLSKQHQMVLRVKESNVIFLRPEKPIDISSISRGILFVFAEWSESSIRSFRALNNAVESVQDEFDFVLLIANIDSASTQHFLQEMRMIPGGNGESFWIRDGLVVGQLRSEIAENQIPEFLSMIK